MSVFSQSALAVNDAGGDLKSQESAHGLPTRFRLTWPGRQYTNLLRSSQARQRSFMHVCTDHYCASGFANEWVAFLLDFANYCDLCWDSVVDKDALAFASFGAC
jgi:hypothetical protein